MKDAVEEFGIIWGNAELRRDMNRDVSSKSSPTPSV